MSQDVVCWKIAPGKGAEQWEDWRDRSYVAIGWNELGDLSECSRAEFEERRAAAATGEPGMTERGMEVVWKFAHEMKPGDRVLANRGKSEVIGIGTVVGDYQYEPEATYAHRRAVRWDDLRPVAVDEPSWSMTMVRVVSEKFEAIAAGLGVPFSRIFKDKAQVEQAFHLLRRTLDELGAEHADDPRIALTVPKNESVLRLNFGQFMVVDFKGHRDQVGLTLPSHIEELAAYDLGEFKTAPLSIYDVPWSQVFPMTAVIEENFRKSLAHLRERCGPTSHKDVHQLEVARAIWDVEGREGVLRRGVTPSDRPFGARAFELLQALRDEPTAECLARH
ncbi:MAG: hypothetical protein KC910_24030 [Candidatus Eremiobacteraeota bacterium]|nr:hypothetical protein [Candidatus Eremiobacteraeota bacterium]